MPRPSKVRPDLPGAEPPAAARRQEWERLHGMVAPAALSPDFLQRDIAYRLQADEHGGLSANARRRLAELATGNAGGAREPRTPTSRIRPGSTLLREWHGKTYTVLALDQGFEMAGQRFASLSEIARHITGAHWSGPRFFGVRRSAGPVGANPGRLQAGDAADA